jgi:hypothetical protein
MAASSLAVAKQLPLRNHPPVGLSQSAQPSGLGDLSRLFYQRNRETVDPNGKTVNKVTRLSSAALVYSVDKSTSAQAGRLLRGGEGNVLTRIHDDRSKPSKRFPTKTRIYTDRSCPYCRLFLKALYLKERIPRIVIVNHTARVDVDFSAVTNISEASIDNFQALVPTWVADELICLAHPFHWNKLPGTLFKKTSPVESDGSAFPGDQASWEKLAGSSSAFLFEDVALPINDTSTAEVQNVLCISAFDPVPKTGQGSALSYEYSLQRCVRSNFGVAFEPSGLDVDSGKYRGFAVPVKYLAPSTVDVSATSANPAKVPLGHLRLRDVKELQAQYNETALDDLYEGWAGDDNVTDWDGAVRELVDVGNMLEAQEGIPYSFVTVSASKRLHFTVPEFSPIELWQILTWTAPAFLFTFLNLAVALAPHIVIEAGRQCNK